MTVVVFNVKRKDIKKQYVLNVPKQSVIVPDTSKT